VRVVEGDHGGEAVARRPAHAQAHRLVVVLVVVLAGVGFGHVAVVVDRGGGEAHGEGVGERLVAVEPRVEAAVVADRDLDRSATFLVRRPAHQLDRAAGGVLAVQRALRAAQHLDPFDVEQGEQGAVDARVVHVVDVHADARVEGLQRIRLADAADEDVGRARLAAALHDVEVGHRALQAVDLLRLQVAQFVLVEGADRDRHVLRGLLAAPRGDRDVAQFPGAFGLGGRLGRRLLRGGFGRRIGGGLRLRTLRPCRRGRERGGDGERERRDSGQRHGSPSS